MTSPLWEQSSFERLADLYGQDVRRLIVFSGAGASREVGLPDWPMFVSRLKQHYAQNARTAIGEALINENLKAIDNADDPWKKVGKLKETLGGQYEIAVRNILTPPTDKLSTFYRRVWDLNPHALLSINIDGLTQASYAALKTGVHPDGKLRSKKSQRPELSEKAYS